MGVLGQIPEDAPASTEPPLPSLSEAPMGSMPSSEVPRQAAVDRIARFIAERPALVIGGASAITTLLLLGALVFAIASGGEKAVADASASARAVAATPAVTSSEATSSPRPPASSLGEPEPLPTQLELIADQPIARVRIGKRIVNVEVPAPAIAIDLTPAESRSRLAVVATTQDGRSASTTWSAGESRVPITFGDAPPAHAAAKPKARPKTKTKTKRKTH